MTIVFHHLRCLFVSIALVAPQMVEIGDPYSDSLVLFKNLNLYVDGSFSGHNVAYLNVDVCVSYGHPLGSKIKRSSTTVELYQNGAQRYRLEDLQFLLENPLSFIRSSAVLELKWFFNKTEDHMKKELFTIQNITWNDASQQTLNISFDRANWYLSLSYKKNCDKTDYYGFQCNVYCPKPTTASVCYQCDPVNGEKTCCKDPDYDQNTCARIGSGNDSEVPESCEDQLSRTRRDYDHQKKWRTLFFWMTIAFALIAFVLFLIILCCLLSLVYYRNSQKQQLQSFKPVEHQDWPRQPPSIASSHNNEVYRQPVKRHKVSPMASPEVNRRALASVASVESDFRTSMEYTNYPGSPTQRRRLEQLV